MTNQTAKTKETEKGVELEAFLSASGSRHCSFTHSSSDPLLFTDSNPNLNTVLHPYGCVCLHLPLDPMFCYSKVPNSLLSLLKHLV